MSQEFFDIAVRLQAARLKESAARAEERRALADLLRLSGLKRGDILSYGTIDLSINVIEVDIEVNDAMETCALKAEISGSPLTAAGAPSKRETNRSAMKIFKEHTADFVAVMTAANAKFASKE